MFPYKGGFQVRSGCASCVIAAAVVMCTSPSALAATTIGANDNDGSDCSPNALIVQRTSSGPSYTVPSAVRARDAAGNVDATPATDDWKVKKKKRR